MSAAKKPRKKAKHPGVVLIKPNEQTNAGWRARWTDPDSLKTRTETLNEHACRTLETRANWAKAKSDEIKARAEAIRGGAPRAIGRPLAEVINSYFETVEARQRPPTPKTLVGYREASRKLLSWADRARVSTCDDLTFPRLKALREWLLAQPATIPLKGGKKGERVQSLGVARSAFTVNRDFASLRAILGSLVEDERFPWLTESHLKRSFKKVRAEIEEIEFLRADEVHAVLEAALRHDAATFTESRAEHAGVRPRGTTARYEPVAPFVALILLSGMRRGEAFKIDWGAVSTEEPGSIKLTASQTKTARGRTIDLTVSPALRALLTVIRSEGKVVTLAPDAAKSSLERLRSDFGAPERFTWQALRRTCSTYLSSAPGIYGGASAFRSAKQLGHSVVVASKHYSEAVQIPHDAKTLEAALGIEALMTAVIEAAKTRQVRASATFQRQRKA